MLQFSQLKNNLIKNKYKFVLDLRVIVDLRDIVQDVILYYRAKSL